MPQLSVKKRSGEVVVTICDSGLFGKKLSEDDLSLEIEESFYKGEEADMKKCLEALSDATIANLVGSIVEHAVEEGYIDSENVLEIEGVPHAQMARL